MKKITSLLLICLAAVFMLSGCNSGKTNEPEKLSAEEILALPKGYGTADRVFFPKNFSEVWERYKSPTYSASVVKGKAVSVKYYFGFEQEECCTLVDFQIEDVIDEYNISALKPGDKITIYSESHITFTDKGVCNFFSEKLGIDLPDDTAVNAAREARRERGDHDAASGMFELVPKKGVNYLYNMVFKDDYPIQEGDSYTMLVYPRKLELHDYYMEESYYALYIMPLNEELSYENLNEKYGWNLKPYGEIYKEIAALFE